MTKFTKVAVFLACLLPIGYTVEPNQASADISSTEGWLKDGRGQTDQILIHNAIKKGDAAKFSEAVDKLSPTHKPIRLQDL